MIVKDNSKRLVKSGQYSALLVEIKPIKSGYGERLGFLFEINEGFYKGRKLMRTCTPTFKSGSNLAEIVESLNRTTLTAKQVEQGIDLEQFKNKPYQITVTKRIGKNGFPYSHIEKIN